MSYFSDTYEFSSPVFLAGTAGNPFEVSVTPTYYWYNDAQDIEFGDIYLLTIDQDTSSGTNEHAWLQYRVLWEYTNSNGDPESIWTPWATTLRINDYKPLTDLAGNSISVPDKVLRYYANSSTLDLTRDVLIWQVRVQIPRDSQTQLKDDLSPSIRCGITDPNTNGGRP